MPSLSFKSWIGFYSLILLIFSVKSVAEEVYPQRIIALAPHIVESLYEIGAGDRIVATVDYADHPAEALSIPRVGGYYGLQMEKILELNPDLIIVWKNGNRAEDIKKLKQLGLPLAYSESGKVADVAKELIQFGELTGLTEQASKSADEFKQTLSSIKSTYQNKTSIKGFYQLWPQPMRTVNKNTWIHELMMMCGIDNVFADASTDYPQIGVENVVVSKPELIILPDEKSKTPQPKINWQPWSVIPAVKNDAFIGVNADLIHRFSKRMLIGLEDMCKQADQARNLYK